MRTALPLLFVLLLVGCGPLRDGADGGGDSGSDGGGLGGGAGGGLGGGAGGGGGGGGGGGVNLDGRTDGGFCDHCAIQANCEAGSLCLGLLPRCGVDCSSTPCPQGATCTTITSGKLILGRQCVPDDAACGPGSVDPLLSCTDTWTGYGQGFFATTCVGSCHRHEGLWTSVGVVRAEADDIRRDVDNGSMPQDQTLSPAERARLLTWLACGAP